MYVFGTERLQDWEGQKLLSIIQKWEDPFLNLGHTFAGSLYKNVKEGSFYSLPVCSPLFSRHNLGCYRWVHLYILDAFVWECRPKT